MIFKLEVFLLHFFVFGLHTEVVLNCFFQGIQQLIKCFGTITKEVCLHIDITSMRFIVFVQIKLIKQSWFVLVQDIPGDTGIIRDQHFALHKQFIYRCVTERFQVNTVTCNVERFCMCLEDRVQIKVCVQIIFFQKIFKTLRIEQCCIMTEIVAFFKLAVRSAFQPASPCRHNQNIM